MFASKQGTQSVPITGTVLVLFSPLLLLRTCAAFALTRPSLSASHKCYATSTSSRISRWMTSEHTHNMEEPAATVNLDEEMDDDDDENARSQFGKRQYWDDVYLGQGDFPAEEYCKHYL